MHSLQLSGFVCALLQDGHQGCIHRVWQEAQELADAQDVDFVQFTLLGQTGVVAASPEAVNCIVQRQQWMPKWTQAHSIFRWMVRMRSTLKSPK
jgi:hypothetical protein